MQTAKVRSYRSGLWLLAVVTMVPAVRAGDGTPGGTPSPADAGVAYYVNDATGNDDWNGRCAERDGGTCGPKKTIQAAINVSVHNDEVVVAPGTYKGDGNRDLDYAHKAITVRSTNPDDPAVVAATVIDCEGTETDWHCAFIFYTDEGPGSVVSGLTIIHGWWPDYGGGIFMREASPTITKCTISDCSIVGDSLQARYGGAGIFCYLGAPTISDCTITGNSAKDYGGGIYVYASNATITRCTITGNSADYGGGGIEAYVSDVTITDCTITGNSAAGYGGGGILCEGGKPRIENCRLSGNTAGTGGGGIFCRTSSALVNGCDIRGNTAETYGGGVFCYDSSNATIVNCAVISNSSANGGGVACHTANPIVANCTMAGNSATAVGGGVYCASGLTITSCILWGDTAPAGPEIGARIAGTYPTRLFVRYTDVQGGQALVDLAEGCMLDWGSGNTDADPLFVDPDGPDDAAGTWQDNDCHLAAASPCVDAGTNADVPAEMTTDCDGSPRIADGDNDWAPTVDMGAYELAWMTPSDDDRDGDVDLADFLTFQTCFNGPNRTPKNAGCGSLDLDRDHDVDLADFLTFQTCFNGPNRTAKSQAWPSISCPAAIELVGTDDLTPVALGTCTATDAVGAPLAVANDAPLEGFPVGIRLVTWSAVDKYGQAATCRQSVAVRGPVITTGSGLQYQDYVIGTGAMPPPDGTVGVKYVGTLENGTVFDQSEWAEFELTGVIQGFAEGISSMRVGGQRRLIIPPELGYGTAGKPPTIPPNATLIFMVDLLGVRAN